MSTLGERVAARMKELELSQEQVAERLRAITPDGKGSQGLIATDTHHIARPFGVGFTRELVMFYKLNKAGGR